jgi:hypothetical protein
VKRPGDDGQPQTRRFAVPVLDVEVSPGQLMAGERAYSTPAGALPADVTVGDLRPITDGSARLTPVPAALPSGPSQSVAEQVAQVDDDTARPPRSNAAQPLPATGLQPRTAAQAAADEPAVEGMNSKQRGKMNALMRELEIIGHGARIAYVSKVIGREVKSSNEVAFDEGNRVIDALEADKKALAEVDVDTHGDEATS